MSAIQIGLEAGPTGAVRLYLNWRAGHRVHFPVDPFPTVEDLVRIHPELDAERGRLAELLRGLEEGLARYRGPSMPPAPPAA